MVYMTHFEHGKTGFKWCDKCGTLILGHQCDVCSGKGRYFEVSNPGDLRPAFGKSQELLIHLFQKYFGITDLFKGKLLFLNKVAGEDRTDEIIFQGTTIGVLRFDLRTNDFALDLRLDGALLLSSYALKGIVILHHSSGHLKGKTLPGSSVQEIRGEFSAGIPLS